MTNPVPAILQAGVPWLLLHFLLPVVVVGIAITLIEFACPRWYWRWRNRWRVK